MLEKISFIKETGANAIELGLSTHERLYGFKVTKEILKALQGFEYISIHAPFIETRYKDSEEVKKTIKKLKEIFDKIKANVIVVHPDEIKDFRFLAKQNLKIAFENMDKRKEFGQTAEDMKKIKDQGNFKFILDLQHAYEADSSMKIVDELMKVMGKNLQHIHISGQTKKENHIAVCLAENKKQILNSLQKATNVPIISEGVLIGDLKEVARKDLRLIEENLIKA